MNNAWKIVRFENEFFILYRNTDTYVPVTSAQTGATFEFGESYNVILETVYRSRRSMQAYTTDNYIYTF